MLRCLGDYPLCSITKEIIRVQKFNHRRACWYVVCRGGPVEANLSNKHVEMDLQKVNLSTEHVEVNLSASGWIIPPSLRKNGLHCVFVQVRKLVGYFISRVPFSLHGNMSSFSHLKQGNGFRPYMTYASSHDGVINKRFLNIWMDVFGFFVIQFILFQQWHMVWSKQVYIKNRMQAKPCRNVELKSVFSNLFKDTVLTISQSFHLSVWTSEALLLYM